MNSQLNLIQKKKKNKLQYKNWFCREDHHKIAFRRIIQK